jgi:hypothetical protein
MTAIITGTVKTIIKPDTGRTRIIIINTKTTQITKEL